MVWMKRSVECDCGSRHYERDWNGEPVWVCVHCLKETPRRFRARRTDAITPSQKATVDFLRENHLRVASGAGEERVYDFASRKMRVNENYRKLLDLYEQKRFDVELRESGDVLVVSEIGRKDDEGTVLALVLRDRRYFLVGRNGGIRLMNAEKKSKSRGRRNALYARTQ